MFAGVKIIATPPSKGATKGHGHGEHEHAHGPAAAVMSDAKVAAAGIQLDKAAPGTLRDSLRLNGVLQSNQEQTVQITLRFPGIVRDVRKRVGDTVQKNEVVATVESIKA